MVGQLFSLSMKRLGLNLRRDDRGIESMNLPGIGEERGDDEI
jgi:hypothetical protein